jgi:casein kinase 1
MKLNNGKGWEAMKQHPSAAHLNHGIPNTSQRELHNATRVSKAPMTPDRLNADLPKPGATRAPAQGAGRHVQRRDPGYTQDLGGKRQSNADFRAPEGGSTVAQFQHSTANLGGQPRSSGVQQPAMQNQQSAGQQPRPNEGQPEEKWFQKLMKTLCCGL